MGWCGMRGGGMGWCGVRRGGVGQSVSKKREKKDKGQIMTRTN